MAETNAPSVTSIWHIQVYGAAVVGLAFVADQPFNPAVENPVGKAKLLSIVVDAEFLKYGTYLVVLPPLPPVQGTLTYALSLASNCTG